VIRSAFRFGLRAILLSGCVAGLVTLVRRRSSSLAPDDGRQPWPQRPGAGVQPPRPGAEAQPERPVAVPPLAAWVESQGKVCPATHPVKAKQSSNIFHVPGGLNYERTVPDRCYRDEAAAIADGFVKSRR
jgi:hypothetical protein